MVSDRRAARFSRLVTAVTVVDDLAGDLEFGLMAATGLVGWLVGMCSLILAVCWHITTPVAADPLGAR